MWEQIAQDVELVDGRCEPYEPDQMARLYSLTRAAGWEVFFLTNRPASAGDTVQFQTQWWIERYGFYLPAVLTVPGSRGEVANGLRLDLVVDDLVINCVEVVSASTAKAILLLRNGDKAAREARDRSRHRRRADARRGARRRSSGCTTCSRSRRGRLLRLADWFLPADEGEALPLNPRVVRPLPPVKEPK